MKKKPDLDAFLGGGAADIADRTELAQQGTATKQATGVKVHREQKVFRLPLDLINVLKKEAYERSIASGGRVTETELVEQALREFFKIKL
ncbi:MAG: hypothetical protein EO766_16415 [Hydrotalea sp. AMD]|uniref:hypothetical protein n=1 Tax=Hydrotalea sp. AMD TaxID=2501297 RepID=UPI001024C66F|nr:hypothetical protein [Hydrotalea sp. AMD]RWZ85646.1 MAG: hypothetical protein EO766_16415 [Hydrotalea sp. AMD]